MRGSNQRTIREVIRGLFADYRLTSKYNETLIRMQWEEIVGPMVARHTEDLRLEGRVLRLRVDSAPLRQELRFMAERLAARINEEMGESLVDSVEPH